MEEQSSLNINVFILLRNMCDEEIDNTLDDSDIDAQAPCNINSIDV
jgi:hypothetical protein